MGENKIGRILKVIGIIVIIFGIISSLIAAWLFPILTTYGMDMHIVQEIYNWPLAILGSVASFISGMLMIGFGENLQFLEKNKFYLKKIQEKFQDELKLAWRR